MGLSWCRRASSTRSSRVALLAAGLAVGSSGCGSKAAAGPGTEINASSSKLVCGFSPLGFSTGDDQVAMKAAHGLHDVVVAHNHFGTGLAHSTHVKGAGSYEGGVERPRIQVTLATGIGPEECRALNLGYRDPRSIDPERWRSGSAERRLHVPKAGETLYRLRGGRGEPGGRPSFGHPPAAARRP